MFCFYINGRFDVVNGFVKGVSGKFVRNDCYKFGLEIEMLMNFCATLIIIYVCAFLNDDLVMRLFEDLPGLVKSYLVLYSGKCTVQIFVFRSICSIDEEENRIELIFIR